MQEHGNRISQVDDVFRDPFLPGSFESIEARGYHASRKMRGNMYREKEPSHRLLKATAWRKREQQRFTERLKLCRRTTTAQPRTIPSNLRHLIMDNNPLFADAAFCTYYCAFEGLFKGCYHLYQTYTSCQIVWDESIQACAPEMTRIPLVRTLEDQKVYLFSSSAPGREEER